MYSDYLIDIFSTIFFFYFCQSFQWMSRVLQAVDSIHQVGIYCLALVPPNYLPKTPLGGIHLSETKRRFLEGTLHPANVLLCPHTCVTNLPKPREVHSGRSRGRGLAAVVKRQAVGRFGRRKPTARRFSSVLLLLT